MVTILETISVNEEYQGLIGVAPHIIALGPSSLLKMSI